MKKILWFDVETGGIDEKKNALLQLSALIEIDNKVVDEFDMKMRPFKGKTVLPDAIKTHGMTLDMIKSFDDADTVFPQFIKFLSKYGEAGNKAERYIMAGYNADFDCRFLSEWFFDITGGPYAYWDYLQFSPIDVLPTLRAMRYAGILPTPDTKLETVCNHYGIEIKAHDSLSDIRATRELTSLIFGRLWHGFTGEPYGLLGRMK